jgi:hypothetical protein
LTGVAQPAPRPGSLVAEPIGAFVHLPVAGIVAAVELPGTDSVRSRHRHSGALPTGARVGREAGSLRAWAREHREDLGVDRTAVWPRSEDKEYRRIRAERSQELSAGAKNRAPGLARGLVGDCGETRTARKLKLSEGLELFRALSPLLAKILDHDQGVDHEGLKKPDPVDGTFREVFFFQTEANKLLQSLTAQDEQDEEDGTEPEVHSAVPPSHLNPLRTVQRSLLGRRAIVVGFMPSARRCSTLAAIRW